MADVALVLSVIAILVALWAAWSSHRAARASQLLAKNDEERRAEERERRDLTEAAAKRADLRVRHEKTAGKNYLVVSNNGPAIAQDVGIEPAALRGEGRIPHLVIRPGEVPLEQLRPGAEAHFLMSFAPPQDVQVRLTWNDEENGRHEERRWVQRSSLR